MAKLCTAASPQCLQRTIRLTSVNTAAPVQGHAQITEASVSTQRRRRAPGVRDEHGRRAAAGGRRAAELDEPRQRHHVPVEQGAAAAQAKPLLHLRTRTAHRFAGFFFSNNCPSRASSTVRQHHSAMSVWTGVAEQRTFTPGQMWFLSYLPDSLLLLMAVFRNTTNYVSQRAC